QVWRPVALLHKGLQYVAGQQKAPFHLVVTPLELPVFVFDDHWAVIAYSVEPGKEPAPVDLAKPRHARDLPANPDRHYTVLIEPVTIDHQVLGMDVQHVRSELADEAILV